MLLTPHIIDTYVRNYPKSFLCPNDCQKREITRGYQVHSGGRQSPLRKLSGSSAASVCTRRDCCVCFVWPPLSSSLRTRRLSLPWRFQNTGIFICPPFTSLLCLTYLKPVPRPDPPFLRILSRSIYVFDLLLILHNSQTTLQRVFFKKKIYAYLKYSKRISLCSISSCLPFNSKSHKNVFGNLKKKKPSLLFQVQDPSLHKRHLWYSKRVSCVTRQSDDSYH